MRGHSPSRRICPHLPPPPDRKGKIAKISHFWQIFGFLLHQIRILPPRCPLPPNNFWCLHRVQYPLMSSPTKQSGAAFSTIRSVIWGVGLLCSRSVLGSPFWTVGCWCFGYEIPCLVDDETCISGMG